MITIGVLAGCDICGDFKYLGEDESVCIPCKLVYWRKELKGLIQLKN